MALKSLLPFSGNRAPSTRAEDLDPLPAFRREMNRLFEDFFTGLPMFGFRDGERVLMPQIDVSETDQELQVVAELPGIEEKDIEVTVADDLLTIRGEKKEEHEQKDRNYRVMERAHGTFLRTLRLPFAADSAQVNAVFKDGVLRITIPKPQEVQQKTRRIEVKREEGTSRASPQPASSPRQTQPATEQKVPETAAE